MCADFKLLDTLQLLKYVFNVLLIFANIDISWFVGIFVFFFNYIVM